MLNSNSNKYCLKNMCFFIYKKITQLQDTYNSIFKEFLPWICLFWNWFYFCHRFSKTNPMSHVWLLSRLSTTGRGWYTWPSWHLVIASVTRGRITDISLSKDFLRTLEVNLENNIPGSNCAQFTSSGEDDERYVGLRKNKRNIYKLFYSDISSFCAGRHFQSE